MLLKSNHIKKAFSAIILVMLLFIHSIKLLHSHSNDNFSAKSDLTLKKSSTDCSICNYQLNKDADDVTYLSCCDHHLEPVIFDTKIKSLLVYSFHTAFAHRGPPVQA